MNRRTLLGIGISGLGGLATVGSGAFSVVQTERDAEIEVVEDRAAYLAIEPLGNGGRSGGANPPEGQIVFRFPGPDSQFHPLDPDVPNGVGPDSVYEFSADKDGPEGLARVTNQGSKTIEVSATHRQSGGPKIELFDVDSNPDDSGFRPAISADPVVLDPGNKFRIGVRISTIGVESGGGDGPNGEYRETVRFIADSPD